MNVVQRRLDALIRSIMIDERRSGGTEPDVFDGTENDVVARHRLDLHHAAIERDDGIYGHHYYAIFFKDPDGNPLEVVCYESEE